MYENPVLHHMRHIVAPTVQADSGKISPMSSSLLAAQTSHSHLSRLVVLRFVAILSQLATLVLVHHFLGPDFAWAPMIGAVSFLTLVNILTWWRLSLNYPVGNLEIFLQLSIDVLVLTVLLYYGGGSTNPFVSIYLLPLVLAAATLPRHFTWSMAGLTLTCYSLLMVWYVPLPNGHAAHMPTTVQQMGHSQHGMGMAMPAPSDASVVSPLMGDAFNTHVLGMWLEFMISAAVVSYFAVEMAQAVRIRDAQLTRIREEILRNERIVALGTQAAGAAHELSTPLATMSVVIGEMRADCNSQEQLDNLNILNDQVHSCKRTLDSLLAHAQESSSELSLEEFFRALLDEWQLLRPTVHYRLHVNGSQPSPHLRAELALRSALLNLLNNAADASPDELDIHLRWDTANITLEIHDHGSGLTPEVAARAGSAFFSTKQEGRGLGLFLANATLEKLGGSVSLTNREGGGATTEVILPLRSVSV